MIQCYVCTLADKMAEIPAPSDLEVLKYKKEREQIIRLRSSAELVTGGGI